MTPIDPGIDIGQGNQAPMEEPTEDKEFEDYDFKETVLPIEEEKQLIRFNRRICGNGPELSDDERAEYVALRDKKEGLLNAKRMIEDEKLNRPWA